MEKLKKPIEKYSGFILRVSAVRNIIKDAYALAETIEDVLRHTPASFRRAKKDSYKTKNMKLTLCELIANGGIRIHMQFFSGLVIYNKILLTIDKNGDYSISILSTSLNDLIDSHNDILKLLFDLTNNRNYTYIRPILTEEHAIIIDDNSVGLCIESSRCADNIYYKLKYNTVKYIYDDTEHDAIVSTDLKAAYIHNSIRVLELLK